MSRESSGPGSGVVRRRSARIVLLDEQDRALLFRHEDPRLEIASVWITPGGGLAKRETYVQAAQRELWEETGLMLPLGPCVWFRRHTFRFGGPWYEWWERYFVARTRAPELSQAHWDPAEVAVIRECRWWTLAELERSDATFAPSRIAALLPDVIAGRYPARPLVLGL
jgi:ADP-ribose pyrophosphatase YjhB (NUDIX family)